MGVTLIQYHGYICDKCGHKWISKKERKVNPEEDYKKVQAEFEKEDRIKKPKICPKCKTKKWNYLGIGMTNSMNKELLKMYKEKYGKETADYIREMSDLKFKKKKLTESIEKLKKDLSIPELKKDKEYIKSTKNLIKEFEEMLKDLEKFK